MNYIATYDGYTEGGSTLKEAYETLLEEYASFISMEDIIFYECKEIETTLEIMPKKETYSLKEAEQDTLNNYIKDMAKYV